MVTVRFFAMLKGIAKTEGREYDIKTPITIRELKARILSDIPALKEAFESRSILVSINHDFASDDSIVKDDDEVGFLPPFSGG